MVKWSSTGVVSKPASNLLMQLVEKRSCWERLAREFILPREFILRSSGIKG